MTKNQDHHRNYMCRTAKIRLRNRRQSNVLLSSCSAAVHSAEARVAGGRRASRKTATSNKPNSSPLQDMRVCRPHCPPESSKAFTWLARLPPRPVVCKQRASWGVNNGWYSHATLSGIFCLQHDFVGHTVSPNPRKIWCHQSQMMS
jgi:hypothetical protein